MNLVMEQNSDKRSNPKKTQEAGAMLGKDHAMLERISEVRRKCGNGVKMLPVVRYERKVWFLDERLRQLRNVRNPHDFINLKDFEVKYFMRKVV